MEAMPHGYTNSSTTDGHVVVKTYLGPDRAARQVREERALRTLAGVLPVPTLLTSVPGVGTTAYMQGIPGQAAIAAGNAAQVLYACGRLLADVQSVAPSRVLDHVSGDGSVLVHNDFGPNNVVLDLALTEVRLLCDWEWVTAGSRLTDLAWAEFIVRFHHPESVAALAALFDGFGNRPTWAERQAAMATRAVAHRDFVRRWHGNEAAETWDGRLRTIGSWREVG